MSGEAGDVAETSATTPTPPTNSDAPQLTRDQFARLVGYGVAQDVRRGDVVFRPGDPAYDLIVIEAGRIEIVSPATRDEPEAVVATYGPGGFLGELNLLTGQTAYLVARVVEAGRIHRISHARFRQLMADDPQVSDVLLRTFLTRRDLLRAGPAARGIEILGSAISADALAPRTYAVRQRLPHLWLDADSVAGRTLMRLAPLEAADLPAVVTPDQVLRRATPGLLADTFGALLSARLGRPDGPDDHRIGADRARRRGRRFIRGTDNAVARRRRSGRSGVRELAHRNHLGFPSGISGYDLTQRAALQALKFGTQLSSPCQVTALDTTAEYLRVVLADGTSIDTRAVLIATGARYRALPLARWAEFEAAGIYYAATELEARACAGEPVTVVGGANSAGQAALYLASRGNPVTVAVRGPDLAAEMSAYLVDRLYAHSQVTVRTTTEITGLDGAATLETITLTDTTAHDSVSQPCRGLFCFIGADPATAWDHGAAVNADGFLRTDIHLDPDTLDPMWTALGRAPLPFETSVTAVFAAGDVRTGSVKRVASAIGDGASAIRSIHAVIGARV